MAKPLSRPFTMDRSDSTITISSHNVNGYSRSKEFLHSLCEDHPDSIRAIQEHWLRPPYKKHFGVNQLRCLHEAFDGFGSSAMDKSVQSKISVGRPYGGTGFIYHKKFSKCLKPLLNYQHERVSVMELRSDVGRILLINVYFPYYNSRDLNNYINMYRETIGFIENIITLNRDSKFIITADFNCNIYDTSHVYSKMILDLMSEYGLVSCFDSIVDFDHHSAFTRYDVKTGSYTLIDGILLSKDLVPFVDNVRISLYGNNVSDHVPVEIDLHIGIEELPCQKNHLPRYVNWSKLTDENLSLFRSKMSEGLASLNVQSDALLHGDRCCLDDSHKLILEQYYSDIVTAVSYAESFLPKSNPNIQRSFWNPELNELKKESQECFHNWKGAGCPRSGPIFDCKKNCHYRYKTALRKSKVAEGRRKSDKLYANLLDKNGISFWNNWNSINKMGPTVSTRIDGETEDERIASAFAGYFSTVYGGNDTDQHIALNQEFYHRFSDYFADHINDSLSPYFLSWADMVDIAAKIKLGKSVSGSIKPEHFIYGSPELLVHFHLLFNGMLQHGFVPTDFLKGTVSPIIKDTQGDVSAPSNYRGITLSVLPAKLFEFAVQKKTAHLLGTDELQFGFKQKTSTAHALNTLKTTIDHFNNRGSKVFVAFLDCTKAFDRISHSGLFTKLIERKIPLCILLCLIFWYHNMISVTKWGTAYSLPFPVPLGIKQGGINSPDLFAIYFDGITKLLREKKIGCHIFNLFLAIILFADDICLLAPTRSVLAEMISAVSTYCTKYGLEYNPTKSKVSVFTKAKADLDSFCPIYLADKPIEYARSVKHLGTTILSDNRAIGDPDRKMALPEYDSQP